MNKCCTKVKHLLLIKSTKLSESANIDFPQKLISKPNPILNLLKG